MDKTYVVQLPGDNGTWVDGRKTTDWATASKELDRARQAGLRRRVIERIETVVEES